MDTEKVRLRLFAISKMLDELPVIGKDARSRLTYSVDYLEELAIALGSVSVSPLANNDAKKDVVNNEHDCAES